MIRRAVDILVSASVLLLTSPLLALALLAVRLESAGHPIYRQRRVGLDGRPFDVLKLRTMVDGAEHIGAGLAVNKPGITGWAQVNGRTSLPWSERIELDLFYIAHRSLLLDLRILWRTAAIVFGGSGLYKGQAGGWEGEL
jgi:lipopolysaccharide/colanic/teichoic acid biosynthesis glycosyltransferase